jgi:hypothetical protein
MAEVKTHARTAQERETRLLERGDIYFLYRPKVGTEWVQGFKDVERFYILLKPWRPVRYRLIVIGRKRLPDPQEHNWFWGFVWRLFKDRVALNQALGAQDYETKTRGYRHLEPVRPAAEGIYAIAAHAGHTHLAYALELPEREGPAERELNIEREASYVIAVRNPETSRPPNTGLDPDRDAKFPQKLQDKFRGRRFVPVDPPEFLDYEGAELMFIGASEDPERELGIAFKPDRAGFRSADVLKDLRLRREVAREPLLEGGWA